MKKVILLSLFLQACLTVALAQEKKLISGNFVELKFDDFVRNIESQSSYVFYYNRSETDSFTVTIQVKDAFLPSLLTKIFEKTDFEFTIDKNDHVFITRGRALSLNLPEGFFRGEAPLEVVAKSKVENEEKKTNATQQQPSVENKIIEIGTPGRKKPGDRINISGYVRNVDNGEELSGVNISVDGTRVVVTTDQFGYYSLLLPPGRHVINYSFMGTFDTRRQIILYSEGKLDVDLQNKVIQLKEVVIEPEKERNIRSSVMGMDRLNIAAIKQIPAVMGELDVLRVVMNLPGVKTVGEATTGMNVRGGATDQNLILFNDLNLYNPTHLFGFFSAIDPDLIKDVNLYKSSIPAKFGGRISSVLDIVSLDGNSKKLTGSAGIGPLTGKIALNGPIVKEKTTFALGLRSTYSDWILKLLPEEYKNSSASFYDGTLHISHNIDKKNQIYLNGYYSRDKFSLDEDTRYAYQNMNGNIRWRHNFNSQFYGVFLVGVDNYNYQTKDSTYPVEAYGLNYQISQYKAKVDFNYFLSNKHTLTFGLSSQLYKVKPGELFPWGNSFLVADTLQKEQGLESAVYVSDQFNVSEDFTIDAGLRLNAYQYLGPNSVLQYAPGLPLIEENITGTHFYPNGKIIRSDWLPDYRIGMRYMLTGKTSLKASLNSLSQIIHQISNSTAVTPTDIWKLSDPHILPQTGTQASLGIYRNLKNNTIETSIEVYYKWIKNYLDYKSGANLLMNHHLETDVMNTKGKAYGVEAFVKKSTGKLNGWISYTYSRAFSKQDDLLAGESINGGNWYPSNFDQPHSLAIIANYRFSHRFSLSSNVNYSTGRPITLPIGVFEYEGSQRVLYSDRNAYRIPDYFRMDISMNIEGNHKVHQLTHNSWTVGIYNLFARRNAYSVYFISEGGRVRGYKLSIFGTAIPYLTYNIRF